MSTAFSSATAHSAMRAACETVGLRSDDARPMRMGENALYLLPSEDIVVRVARTLDYLPDVAREVSVSRWLRQGLTLGTALKRSTTCNSIVHCSDQVS